MGKRIAKNVEEDEVEEDVPESGVKEEGGDELPGSQPGKHLVGVQSQIFRGEELKGRDDHLCRSDGGHNANKSQGDRVWRISKT